MESMALEQELAKLRAENARLREQEKRSAQLIRELGDAVAARDSFIAIAGHELRNPMGTVLVAATNLVHRLARSEEPVPAWLAPRLGILERQARSFVRRATTLLDVSRISAGNLSLDPEIVDFSQLTRDTLELFSHDFERGRCVLQTSIEASVCGWWDRIALEQILHNLVQNAIKYGAGKPIAVTISASGGRARLSVADQGIGISVADRERIFARFERAVTERTHGGFGLGLWITQQLVKAHGGTIRVTSEPGAGSIFDVELPQAVER